MRISSLQKLEETAVSHNPEIKKRVMLRNGDIRHLTHFAQAVFNAGQKTIMHSHEDMFETFLVEAGAGYIKVGNEIQPLTEGTYVTVEPGEEHELGNSGQEPLILTYFGIAVGP